MDKPELRLKPMPDGFGLIYGELVAGDTHYRVDIMPPESEWDGDFKLDGFPPHPTDWVVYVDGEEITRVRKRGDLAEATIRALTTS